MEAPENHELGCYEECNDLTTSSSSSSSLSSSNKIKKSKNPKRFTDDQIKSLETIFKQETKLEPRMKVQLARELGLQPRQIAIWFQNRRARWKSRQIEQDYKVLRENYDTLHTQFDHLKKEKQSLQMQLQELGDAAKKLDRINIRDGDAECVTRDNEQTDCYDINSGDYSESMIKYLEEVERKEPVRWGEEDDISQLGSPEAWCSLSSYGIFDHSAAGASSSNWWDS